MWRYRITVHRLSRMVAWTLLAMGLSVRVAGDCYSESRLLPTRPFFKGPGCYALGGRSRAPCGAAGQDGAVLLRGVLRGGRPRTRKEQLAAFRKKFPLGMRLYEAAGGVRASDEDEFEEDEDVEEVKRLLARGANPNFKGPGQYSPLHFAALRGFDGTVQALIEAGADVNATNKWYWTPLHCAATEGKTEVVERLIAAGADLYALVRGSPPKTPLSRCLPCYCSCPRRMRRLCLRLCTVVWHPGVSAEPSTRGARRPSTQTCPWTRRRGWIIS